MTTLIYIVGYEEDCMCAHCGRKLKHGIKISTGEIVGADCFDKQLTKARVSGKKKYRFGAAHIIHIAKVVEYKNPSQWELYNVSQSATKFEAI